MESVDSASHKQQPRTILRPQAIEGRAGARGGAVPRVASNPNPNPIGQKFVSSPPSIIIAKALPFAHCTLRGHSKAASPIVAEAAPTGAKTTTAVRRRSARLMAREASYKQVPQPMHPKKKPHGLSPARAAAATVLYCLAGPFINLPEQTHTCGSRVPLRVGAIFARCDHVDITLDRRIDAGLVPLRPDAVVNAADVLYARATRSASRLDFV